MIPAAARIRRWRENVNAFAHEELGFDPDPFQKELFDVFPSQDPSKQRISLQACAGPGKTAAEAVCALNFMACYGEKGEHPKGACVSVTWDNLRDNFWAELSKWQQRSEFLRRAFVWTKERFFARDHPETWFLSGRAWSKKADPETQARTLSGLHAKYILVIVDESGDIPIQILRAAEQARSSAHWFKALQGGNTTSREGMLYVAATSQRHLWYVIRVTGDPDSAKRSPRIDIQWAREQIALYGRDNPWVMSYILGEFPQTGINELLGVEDVERAMHRELKVHQFDWAQKRLGIDAAWRGDDKWVIFPRQGLASYKPVAMRNPKTEEVGSRIIQAKLKFGSEREYFDDTGGYAAGASDFFAAAGYAPIRIDFSGKASDPRFYNIRAEMYWRAAEAIRKGAGLPNLPELVAEATAATYTYKDGKFLVEAKDQIKKRLKRSPDYWDAYCLTYAEPDMPKTLANQLQQGNRAQTDWDPHREHEAFQAEVDFDPYTDSI